jgi:hypothetical protein
MLVMSAWKWSEKLPLPRSRDGNENPINSHQFPVVSIRERSETFLLRADY